MLPRCYAECMARREGSFLTTRRLLVGTIVFALFLVFDLTLFGYLIFDSLSQRELEAVVFETRQDAQPIADLLAQQAKTYGDLPLALSVQLTIGFVDDVVNSRELVRTVEVRDADGAVIYRTEQQAPVSPGPASAGAASAGAAPSGEQKPVVRTAPSIDGLAPSSELQEVELPIGELGTLVVGVSHDQLQSRLAVLRRDLIRQASAIGILTMLLLGFAFTAIWLLFRRGRVLEDQAQEAERMAYIGTLASGLAHEIRNPLNALSLNMQLLDEEAVAGRLGGSSGRLLTITQSEIRRLERLVSDFLSYARTRKLELEEVPAAQLLENIRALLAHEIRARGAQVDIVDLSDGAEVRVDREQMRQLLLNLTQNALQATERSGHEPAIHLRVHHDGQQVAIEVEDNGCGMDDRARAKIFDIFFSTRRGGTGLGLAIAQRIAKAHRGRLEVDSTPGEGTTMRLLLPRVGARESITQTLTLPVMADRT